MFQIIIGCIIGNVLTIVIIAAILYLYAKKYKDKIISIKNNFNKKIEEVEELLDDFSDTKQIINSIKEKIDKITI